MERRYGRVLAAILLAYAVIIVVDEGAAGGPGRLLVLGYLLAQALRLLRPVRGRLGVAAVWTGAAVATVASAVAAALAPSTVASGVVGGFSFLLTGAVITVLGQAVLRRRRVDTPTVVGVLAVYLLLALLFSSLNQLFSAFDPGGYLSGVGAAPTASDQLYFSVVTLATVGYGDIAPVSRVARAVSVVEALTGQLYLVSVVAAVVGSWHRGDTRGA